jgi:hypothetical protein
VRLTARIGDGYVTTKPDAELVELYRSEGGVGLVVLQQDAFVDEWAAEALPRFAASGAAAVTSP